MRDSEDSNCVHFCHKSNGARFFAETLIRAFTSRLHNFWLRGGAAGEAKAYAQCTTDSLTRWCIHAPCRS
jgi:hypothetical protein